MMDAHARRLAGCEILKSGDWPAGARGVPSPSRSSLSPVNSIALLVLMAPLCLHACDLIVS